MKTIVITGCTRGLGLALAHHFAIRGHTVIGCGRSADKIATLKKELPAPHHFTALDVSSDQEVAAWARRVIKKYSAPDIVLNNAALIAKNAALWEVPAAEFDSVIDVNIKGVANVIRHFLPAMIASGQGVLVNMSSGWGRSTSPEVALYCATKWAIEGLTQALSKELPHGLTAAALNPGIIDTDMLRSCFADSAGHYPTPSEWVKQAAPFILSIGAKDNGRALTVPGAFTD